MVDDVNPEDLPEIEIPWWLRRSHYASIASLLRASGFDAQVFTNGMVLGVQVASISDTGSRDTVVWGNQDTTWAFTVVDRAESGRIRTLITVLPDDTPVEEVAQAILIQDYTDAS